LDVAAGRMVGPRTVLVNGGVDLSKKPIWIEAPHVFRKRGTYYLICAEGGTADQHSEVVFRSDAVTGPYVPYSGNPILTQRHLDPARPFPFWYTGHADFVQTRNGEWWAVFLGVRPYEGEYFNIGRETFMLPVQWRDGWPVILTGSATVPYAMRAPRLPAQPAPAVPTFGNFTVRDGFSGRTLAPHWVQMRTPREPVYDLAAQPGWLTLRAHSEQIGSLGQPSFVGRRQQHLHAVASTAMTYAPGKPGDAAGMVAFQSERHYFFLGVTEKDGQTVLELERHSGTREADSVSVLASAPVRASGEKPLYLKIEARGRWYDFSYGYAPNEWTALQRDVDGVILSTKAAGGFVGTLLGLYAYSPAR
jgi:alpha-N-arabinofuranosidase